MRNLDNQPSDDGAVEGPVSATAIRQVAGFQPLTGRSARTSAVSYDGSGVMTALERVVPQPRMRRRSLAAVASDLSRAWDELRSARTDLPEAVFGSSHKANVECWDTNWSDRPLVLLVGTDLSKLGAVEQLEWLAHRAAHAIAGPGGGFGSASRGRYHKPEYRSAARHLGLTTQRVAGLGWSKTALPENLAGVANLARLLAELADPPEA